MGSPDSFTVLELGPGRGETGDEIRRCMPDVKWIPVEHDGRWPDRPVVGAVFCNEFFDALPVDLVERRGDDWIEWRVGLSEGRFAWQPGNGPAARHGLPRIGEGRRIETCERQVAAMERIHSVLARGWVLAIDYGYTHNEIERGGRFPDGSLMGYSGHRADPDVLVEPGRRDITAHVNFSALENCGRAAGFEVFRYGHSRRSCLARANRTVSPTRWRQTRSPDERLCGCISSRSCLVSARHSGARDAQVVGIYLAARERNSACLNCP